MIGLPEAEPYKRQFRRLSIFERSMILPAIGATLRKLNPRTLVKNPVMFCVEVVAALTTIFFLRDLIVPNTTVVGTKAAFSGQITLWLWFTVLFANFAEAIAERRGKAQADTLRRSRTETKAKRLQAANSHSFEQVDATTLMPGDLVLVEDLIPSDGEVIQGVASVDESAITGESAPVIRESGGDRYAVTGGTRVTSDWIRVRITASHGSTFLARMIPLVEGAVRQKTPNEIALNILLTGMTLIFVFATVTIPSFASYAGGAVSVVVLVALFVTLSRRPSARYCRRSASLGWIGSCALTCWLCRCTRSRRPVMSTPCFSTRRVQSRSAIARRRNSSGSPGSIKPSSPPRR